MPRTRSKLMASKSTEDFHFAASCDSPHGLYGHKKEGTPPALALPVKETRGRKKSLQLNAEPTSIPSPKTRGIKRASADKLDPAPQRRKAKVDFSHSEGYNKPCFRDTKETKPSSVSQRHDLRKKAASQSTAKVPEKKAGRPLKKRKPRLELVFSSISDNASKRRNIGKKQSIFTNTLKIPELISDRKNILNKKFRKTKTDENFPESKRETTIVKDQPGTLSIEEPDNTHGCTTAYLKSQINAGNNVKPQTPIIPIAALEKAIAEAGESGSNSFADSPSYTELVSVSMSSTHSDQPGVPEAVAAVEDCSGDERSDLVILSTYSLAGDEPAEMKVEEFIDEAEPETEVNPSDEELPSNEVIITLNEDGTVSTTKCLYVQTMTASASVPAYVTNNTTDTVNVSSLSASSFEAKSNTREVKRKPKKATRNPRRHGIGSHIKEINVEGEKKYKCTICERVFKTRGNSVYHESCASNKEEFKCEFCGKYCKSKTLLTYHNLKHTGERPFICNECGQSFTQNSKRIRHIKLVHRGLRTFPCDICSKKCATSQQLKIHIGSHTGEKPYKCSTCDKLFTSVYNLRKHEFIHKGIEERHKCKEFEGCSKTFASYFSLMSHVKRVHLKEKSFKCQLCNAEFTVFKDLARHTACLHTKMKAYECKICTNEFSRKDNLMRHLRKVHLIKPEDFGANFTERSSSGVNTVILDDSASSVLGVSSLSTANQDIKVFPSRWAEVEGQPLDCLASDNNEVHFKIQSQEQSERDKHLPVASASLRSIIAVKETEVQSPSHAAPWSSELADPNSNTGSIIKVTDSTVSETAKHTISEQSKHEEEIYYSVTESEHEKTCDKFASPDINNEQNQNITELSDEEDYEEVEDEKTSDKFASPDKVEDLNNERNQNITELSDEEDYEEVEDEKTSDKFANPDINNEQNQNITELSDEEDYEEVEDEKTSDKFTNPDKVEDLNNEQTQNITELSDEEDDDDEEVEDEEYFDEVDEIEDEPELVDLTCDDEDQPNNNRQVFADSLVTKTTGKVTHKISTAGNAKESMVPEFYSLPAPHSSVSNPERKSEAERQTRDKFTQVDFFTYQGKTIEYNPNCPETVRLKKWHDAEERLQQCLALLNAKKRLEILRQENGYVGWWDNVDDANNPFKSLRPSPLPLRLELEQYDLGSTLKELKLRLEDPKSRKLVTEFVNLITTNGAGTCSQFKETEVVNLVKSFTATAIS